MRKPDSASAIAVTGAGIICSIGRNKDEVWQSICESRAGIGKLTRFPGETFPTDIAAEVDEDIAPDPASAKREAKRLSRTDLARGDRGAAKRSRRRTTAPVRCRSIAPSFPPAHRPAVCSKARTTTSAASSADAAARAASQRSAAADVGTVRRRRARVQPRRRRGLERDRVRIGGRGDRHGRGLPPLGSRGRRDRRRQRRALPPHVQRLQRAAGSRSRSPARRSAPTRKGITLGEGAGYLVLERWDDAVARGATILAEFCGYGASCDAHHPTAPAEDGRGAEAAMRGALAESATESRVDYVNAHGTGTLLNDSAETKAIIVGARNRTFRSRRASRTSATRSARPAEWRRSSRVLALHAPDSRRRRCACRKPRTTARSTTSRTLRGRWR